jgi:hypothetical protein
MLFSYKMTHDTGFAPNPFHGVLTLANCKPQIRLKKHVGDYIAGFTSKRLIGDKVGEERLVYIMKVTKKLSYAEYFNDKHFQNKIPSESNLIAKAGDNIYKPAPGEKRGFIQLTNPYHNNKENMDHDLGGKFVLLSNEFFYFGGGAIPIYKSKFNIKIPRVQSGSGVKTDNKTEIENLWQFLLENYKQNIAIYPPHSWKENEPFNL